MKNLFFTLLFLSEVAKAIAQIPSCDGNRYKNFVFGRADSIINVQYGKNYTMNNVFQNLKMDIFLPKADTVTKRPLIIFIHGGGFMSGDKKDVRSICILFALKGFVTAAINYRLIDVPVVDSTVVAEGMVRAMSDAKAAVRFFVEDAATQNNYKTDSNYLFISGVSAGGVIASHVAYLDSTDNIPAYLSNLISANGGFAGNSSNNKSHTAPIKGVINYSGALLRKEFISAGEPALFSVHDVDDTIVPCNHGLSRAYYCPVYCDGSCEMHQQADLQGIYNDIYLNNSSGHCAYFLSPPIADTVIQRTADFLYGLICSTIVTVHDKNELQSEILLFPNPTNETVNIEFSASFSANEHVQLFNSVGILLREAEAKQSVQLNISDLPGGLYFVRMLHSGETRVFTKQ